MKKDTLTPRLKALAEADFRRSILERVGKDAVHEAKALVPRKTGNLDRSIRLGPHDDQRALIYAGGIHDVGYAAYVEFGTSGGQMIRPVRKKALAWGGPRRLSGTLRSGGKAEFFSMGHKRGATRKKPYLVPGAKAALRKAGMKDELVKAWNDAA
jgi:hypothetical protein